jgi:glycosyltransferase involved in cell wall biosynthesis
MSRDRLRVVYFVSTLRRTGPTNQLLNIVQHLDRALFEPMIVTISPEPAASMQTAFEAVDVPVRSMRMGRVQSALTLNWRATLERALGRPLDAGTLIHSQGVRADTIASRHLRDVPRVTTARNYPWDDYPMKYGSLAGRVMAWTHLRALRRLPNVVACSESLGTVLRDEGVATIVIRNGVDTGVFRPPSPGERAELRRGFRLPADARVLVSVGELSQRKNPLNVIRAFARLADPSLRLLFVGVGALDDECRKLARQDDRVTFAGHASSVVPFLQAADAFVSAARSEGMPNSVLEAVACGLPVVLSDIAPHRELLEVIPVSRDSFTPDDTAALAAAMAKAIEGSAAARPALHAILDEIGARRMSSRYQRLYSDTIGAAG